MSPVFLFAQNAHPHTKVGNSKVFYIDSVVCLWTLEGFKD